MKSACAPSVPPSHTWLMKRPAFVLTSAGMPSGFRAPSAHSANTSTPARRAGTYVIHDACGTNAGCPARPVPVLRKPAIAAPPSSPDRRMPAIFTPSRSKTSRGCE